MFMSDADEFDVVILGSGQGGKRLAWHLARSGKSVAVVERRWVGGSCPAVACMPSKNELWSARVAHLVRDASRFGTLVEGVRTDMGRVRRRKQEMIDRENAFHLKAYQKSGAELVMGCGRFASPKIVEVRLNAGGNRHCAPDHCRRPGAALRSVPARGRVIERSPPALRYGILQWDAEARHNSRLVRVGIFHLKRAAVFASSALEAGASAVGDHTSPSSAACQTGGGSTSKPRLGGTAKGACPGGPTLWRPPSSG